MIASGEDILSTIRALPATAFRFIAFVSLEKSRLLWTSEHYSP
jgi:hypothetical protein